MTEYDLDRYLEKNLKIDWWFDEKKCDWYLCLNLKGKVISKIPFEAS